MSAPAIARILLGIARLARFNRDGFAQFGDTPQAFVNSLAPMLAFPLAFVVPAVIGGAGVAALVDFLASVVALLAPAVMSHAFAQAWGREALWLRYIVAFNWLQSAFTLVMVVALYAVAGTAPGGLNRAGFMLPAFMFTCYWLALYGSSPAPACSCRGCGPRWRWW